MRLTEKLKSGNYICGIIKGGFVDKLGKIEDLEEQLGCPLEVLVKALANGIYVKDLPSDSDTFKIIDITLSNIQNEWYIVSKYYACSNTKDYKKTWWLKEDKSE